MEERERRALQLANMKKGVVDLSLMTPSERISYNQIRKEHAKNAAYNNGLNLYNYYCPTGRVQRSYPTSRIQLVFNHEQNKHILIKHYGA